MQLSEEELENLIFSYKCYRDLAQSSLNNNSAFAFKVEFEQIIKASNKKIELLKDILEARISKTESWIDSDIDSNDVIKQELLESLKRKKK